MLMQDGAFSSIPLAQLVRVLSSHNVSPNAIGNMPTMVRELTSMNKRLWTYRRLQNGEGYRIDGILVSLCVIEYVSQVVTKLCVFFGGTQRNRLLTICGYLLCSQFVRAMASAHRESTLFKSAMFILLASKKGQ